jgi:hypothetical protein
MGTAEELAFLLQESGTTLVDASDVLHAIDKALAAKDRLMPRGMTEADAWMARHGNPLASTEAALAVAGMLPNMHNLTIAVHPTINRAIVEVYYDGPGGHAVGDTLPIAICAAVMDALDKKGKTNV